MLTTAKCSVLECQSELKSFKEVSTGICDHCIDLLTDREHYAGVCWNCGTIIGLYEIPRRLERILTEKYLFAKDCQICNPTAGSYLNWITVKKYTGKYYWAINAEGKLVKVNNPANITSNNEYSTRHASGATEKPPLEKLFDSQHEHDDDHKIS
jgi:hypothetical protein